MPREGVSFDNNYIVKLNISKLLIIIIYSRIWNIIKPKAWMRIENRLMFTSSGAGPGFQVKGRTFLGGYFVWKITILRQKILFSPILGGAPGVLCVSKMLILAFWLGEQRDCKELRCLSILILIHNLFIICSAKVILKIFKREPLVLTVT
jgi:hypothetical protein